LDRKWSPYGRACYLMLPCCNEAGVEMGVVVDLGVLVITVAGTE